MFHLQVAHGESRVGDQKPEEIEGTKLHVCSCRAGTDKLKLKLKLKQQQQQQQP